MKKDIYFFGRNDLVLDIIGRHKAGENCGLFGLRKAGKTSVIYGVDRNIQAIDALSVTIDCQSPAFHGKRWYEALHYTIDQISQKYTNFKGSPTDQYTEGNAAIAFEYDIKEASKKLNKKSILLIFDEIENISFKVSPTRCWAVENDFILFWQTVRSAYQKNTSLFTYLIVGTNPYCIELPTINNIDNPIFNQFPPRFIPPFSVKHCEEMVSALGSSMGLLFDDTIYGKLTEDFGGHPFLIRQLCSIIHEMMPQSRPVRVSKATYEEAKTIFKQKHYAHIEMILSFVKNFYADEYSMLEFIANNDYETFKEFADLSPVYTNHLIGYGILERDGNNFFFKIDAVKEFLSAKNKYKRINLTLEEKWSEVSERRNKVEVKLRNIIKTQLRASNGREDAKNIVLNIIGGKKKAQYVSLNYEDLFDPKKVEIYFDDLRKLVVTNWDTFKNIFEGSDKDFDTKMYLINKLRYEAHAKELEDAEMTLFRGSISVIESAVDSYF